MAIKILNFYALQDWEKNLYVLWFGVLLACASYTMIIPFLPIFLLQELSVAPEDVQMWSGLVFSVSFLGGAVMAPVWGAKADRYGKRNMAIRAGLCLGIVYLAISFVQTPTQLFVLRFVQGVISGFVPASMSLVANSLPDHKLGWGLGLMQVAQSSGSILGPLFGGVLATTFGMRASFIVAGSILLLATLAVWMFVKEKFVPVKTQSHSFKQDISTAYNNKPLLHMLALFATIQVCSMILQPLLTLYVAKLQGDAQGAVLSAGIVFSLAGISGIIAAPYWGNTGQRKGFMRTLLIVLCGAGLVSLLQVFSANIWVFGTIQFIYGLFIAGTAPTLNANLVEFTEMSFRGRAFGLASGFQQMGSMLGPIIGGLLGSFLDIKYIFIVTGCILLIAGSTVYKRLSAAK